MPPALPASAPLLWLHPSHCIRRAPRGGVKRIFARGPLVGYQIVCPACGFYGSYLAEESGFVEGEMVADAGPTVPGGEPKSYQHPASLEMSKAVVCYGCRGMLQVIGGCVAVARGT